jgi:adenosylcobinamide kinase / adenosylcobinamide-phosphate guanylyltransferase
MKAVRQEKQTGKGKGERKGVKPETSKRPPLQDRKAYLTVVLGGARSGKSTFALRQGRSMSPKAFVATGEPFDQEMSERIRKHQRSRGKGWHTQEVPLDLPTWFDRQGARYVHVVVDCLTLWLNNLIRAGESPTRILFQTRQLLRAIRACPARVVLVSNELGLGLVPGDAGSRSFRDLMGRMNQLIAAEADEVHLLVSGLPLRLK